MKAQRTFSALPVAVSAAVGGLLVPASPARADPLGKADQILLHHGLLVQGMATNDDVFHPDTFKKANYAAVNWFFTPDFSRQKDLVWGRWVPDEKHMPAGTESSSVDLFDPETGRVSTRALPKIGAPIDSTSRHQLLLHLNGGDAALFKFTTGAPFVGATSTPGAQ